MLLDAWNRLVISPVEDTWAIYEGPDLGMDDMDVADNRTHI
jgi:hypothetical protein